MGLPTISRLQRTEACPASAVLPWVEEPAGAPAQKGHAVHAYLAALSNGAEPALALAAVPEEHLAACEAVDLSRLPHLGSVAAEVAFAYDVERGTSREIGRDIARAYGELGPTEIAGAADILALIEPDAVFVGDYKTGHIKAPAPRENLQLRSLALAAARAHGRSRAVVAIIELHDSSVWYDQAELDEMDLAATAADLRRLWAAVEIQRGLVAAGGPPDVRPGAHCRYCPAWLSCPAQVGLVRQLAQPAGLQAAEKELMTLVTPETASAAWGRLKQVEEVVARVRSALYAYAAEQPFPTANGLVLGPVQGEREEIDGAKARNVLREMFDDAVADTACEVSASKASIKRGLRIVAAKGELASLERQALTAIAAVGGITTKPTSSVKEHAP